MDHFFESIQGWASFRELYSDAVKRFPSGSHFVEIGSWKGKSAAYMAVEIIRSRKNIRFDCIDPWTDGGPDLWHKGQHMSVPLYEQFMKNIAPVRSVVNPIRMTSLEAAALYEDESIDFVMIDGSHQYEDVIDDIKAWHPKVKYGGVVSGDDYNWDGVKQAVHEYYGTEVEICIGANWISRKNNKRTRYWVHWK